MPSRETFILLRFPFSFFLAPAFFFGLGAVTSPAFFPCALLFVILHLCLYTASNSFNSYYDRDTGPIGGVEHPPMPTRELLHWSLGLDALGIALGFILSPWLALACFLYGVGSKLYSWDKTRWKRYAVASWIFVGLAQGLFVYVLTAWVGGGRLPTAERGFWLGAGAISVFLLAAYPLTQVYQHKEDAARGDRTMSMLLGIRGTFIFGWIFLAVATVLFMAYYMYAMASALKAALYFVFQLPLVAYLALWTIRVFRDPRAADYRGMARMNLLSSTFMNAFFISALFY